MMNAAGMANMRAANARRSAEAKVLLPVPGGERVMMAQHYHPDFDLWRGMVARCHNPKRKDYGRYGGKGISVCARWRDSFALFLEDMGCRPALGLSIDRIDGSKGYEPGNCRWATAKEQAQNTNRALSTQSHCGYGHPLEGDNLLITCGVRVCRECNRIRARRSNARRKAARKMQDGSP